MQTKTGTLRPLRDNSLERTGSLRRFTRRKPAKANEAAGGRPVCNFLSTVFQSIPVTRFNPLFNRNNYDFLYLSAKNYSKLLGSSFDFTPQKKDFTKLFRYFEELLPRGQRLLLIEKNKKLSFKVCFGDDFLIGEVFFIPIEILNKTEGMFRDILLSFFQFFHSAYHFPKKENLYDYEMIVDGYFEEWYKPLEDDAELWNFLKAYRDGYINDTFSLIYQKPGWGTGELEKLIESYMS